MSKDNISATVDPEVASYVSRDSVNTSGLVNELLKQHMNGATSEKQMLEFRIEQVESEIQSLQSRLENKQDELKELEARKDDLKSQQQERLEKAVDVLTPEDLDERSRKVEYWAGELNMTVDEFIDQYGDRIA